MELTAGRVERANEQHGAPVKIAAKFFSYLFHPIFIPVFIGWFVIFELRLFHASTSWDRTKLLIMFVMYYTFFPLVVTLLLKALNFIESIHLKNQKDRIIPYVICEIFYFWGWYVFKNMGNTPRGSNYAEPGYFSCFKSWFDTECLYEDQHACDCCRRVVCICCNGGYDDRHVVRGLYFHCFSHCRDYTYCKIHRF